MEAKLERMKVVKDIEDGMAEEHPSDDDVDAGEVGARALTATLRAPGQPWRLKPQAGLRLCTQP